jgi:hypothetical protein
MIGFSSGDFGSELFFIIFFEEIAVKVEDL